MLKQPAREQGDGVSSDPIGVEYVAANVVSNAVEQDVAGRDQARVAIARELELIDGAADEGTALNSWDIESILIDGVDHEGRARDVGAFRAIVVDLPTLVIGIYGPSRCLTPKIQVIDVSGRLSDYAAGSDQRADSLFR